MLLFLQRDFTTNQNMDLVLFNMLWW